VAREQSAGELEAAVEGASLYGDEDDECLDELPASEENLQPGVAVRIHGLKGAAHLNGARGVCESWDAAAGRWHVRLAGGEVKALKTGNLGRLFKLEAAAVPPPACMSEASPADDVRCEEAAPSGEESSAPMEKTESTQAPLAPIDTEEEHLIFDATTMQSDETAFDEACASQVAATACDESSPLDTPAPDSADCPVPLELPAAKAPEEAPASPLGSKQAEDMLKAMQARRDWLRPELVAKPQAAPCIEREAATSEESSMAQGTVADDDAAVHGTDDVEANDSDMSTMEHAINVPLKLPAGLYGDVSK